ncbi:MAG: hypothetical protein E7566_06575 [Ruminococcaceae bacterium]|nr:hypothetical protein [Oscillospiraceae bacterium]
MKKILKTFVVSFASLFFTGFAALFSYGDFFLNDFQLALQQVGVLGFIILLLSCVIIAIAFSLIKNRRLFNENDENESTDISSEKLFDAIASELDRMMGNKEYSDVIRIGSALSRALWISGEYKNRINIGTLVYEAASKINDNVAITKTLIDDIGWTYVVADDYDKAIRNISSGIERAKIGSLNYWIAKGYRHLFNIYLLKNDNKNATLNLNNAEIALKDIKEEKSRMEMENGIEYDKIELLINNKKYDDGIEKGEILLKQYNERLDKERVAKTCSLLGKINYLKGEYFRAIEIFLEGLQSATICRRTDEMIKCSMGLCVSEYMEGNVNRFNYYKEECSKLLNETSFNLIFWDVIINKFNEINN